MDARVHRFVQGLSPLVINEAATTILNSDMNNGKIVAFLQATETCKLKNRMEREGSNKAQSAGNFNGTSGGGGGRTYATGVVFKGHIQRDCRSSHQSMGRGTTQPASSAATTSAAPSPARGAPAPRGCAEARGGAQSSGRLNRFYPMSGCQSSEASPDVVRGILTVQSHDIYSLIYPGSTL
ncbi:uncharacterized protein [Nicotiana tomentosiformis]|uniref:uncharacterized protein n=1 Tax=Nicotiana tomentosiformis TaxID=4098 RepID=UPI00388C62AC